MNETFTVTHSLGCHRKDNSKKLYWNLNGKIPDWECMFAHRKHGLFLSVHVDDIKMAGKKQNLAPVWKQMMKNVDINEPTPFLDHVHLGCTQRECKPSETVIEQYTKMFGSRISAGATEKLPGWQRPHAQTVAWSYDMEGLNWQTRSGATLQSFASLLG